MCIHMLFFVRLLLNLAIILTCDNELGLYKKKRQLLFAPLESNHIFGIDEIVAVSSNVYISTEKWWRNAVEVTKLLQVFAPDIAYLL